MIQVFKLPDLGEGLTESEIVAWLVAPGDEVTLNQHIADVETAKAVVELPSPVAGVVRVLHQPAGVVVQVGEPIVTFDIGGAAEPDSAPTPEVEDATENSAVTEEPSPTEQREANLVGYGPAVERGGHPQRRARPGAVAAAPSAPDPAPTPAKSGGERPRSTPPVRALARDLGIDLDTVAGTGLDGLITREDVRAHISESVPASDQHEVADSSGAPTATPGTQPGTERETRTPIKSLRKLTAAAVVQSAFTAPHVTEFLTVDVTPTVELLDSLRADRQFADAGIGILAVVAKALCLGVDRTPAVNTRWDEPAGEIVQYNYVNLGIAAATPRGLLVPNIVDADRLDLRGIAAALAELTTAARAGTTAPAALSGGTITITNIGVFGIDAGTPILNPGEAAILAMGAIRVLPWEYRGQVALRKVLTLSLSFDHRLVDGEQGSRFLADIGTILADPARVLTMV